MRGLILPFVLAGAAVSAAPAAAQYYPAPQPYGYGYNTYGYNGGYGQVRMLQARIDGLEQQIRTLDRRDLIRDDSADRLRDEAQRLEHRLHRASRDGLNPYEANEIQRQVGWLEQRVHNAWMSRYDRYRGDDRYDRDQGYDHRGYDRDDDRN